MFASLRISGYNFLFLTILRDKSSSSNLLKHWNDKFHSLNTELLIKAMALNTLMEFIGYNLMSVNNRCFTGR
jgi:hypothetical protein